jgi:uncharacterized hydrophobic protein (TIGR00271 family)
MTKIRSFLSKIYKEIKQVLHPMPVEVRESLVGEIKASAKPDLDFFLLVVLSCSIATLGLITGSAAVIIGAMLLAPLMSPIIGIGLASIIGDEKLLKSSALALFIGSGLAIILSVIMTLVNRILPFVALQELSSEIISRTRPSPIDLLIALAGGLAAAYALTRPNLSATLPGVAIATALMPPLCTIGIGIALNRWDVAGGASLLFITNAITIAFAAALIFFIRGFAGGIWKKEKRLPRSLVLSSILVVLLLVPLSFISIKFFREASDNRLINTIVSQEVEKIPGAQLVDIQVTHAENELALVATIRTSNAISYDEVVSLQEAIVAGLKQPVSLKVEQVIAEELNPLIPPTPTLTPTQTFTATPGPSATPTSSSTPPPTATYTPTATPGLGKVVSPILPQLALYQEPGGPKIGTIHYGDSLTMLYDEMEYDGFIWIKVSDSEGRIGWIPKAYLLRITTTPMP